MSVERAFRCGLYLPGHEVHWIQAKKPAACRSADLRSGGQVLEVRPDGRVVIAFGFHVFQLWNHDPFRLKILTGHNGGEVDYNVKFHLLRTQADGPGSNYVFCMADLDRSEPRLCPHRPPTGSPVELLREAGGFFMQGPEALRRLEGER